MTTYSYVDENNKVSNVDAASADAAIGTAPQIASDSGVITPPLTNEPSRAVTTISTDQGLADLNTDMGRLATNNAAISNPKPPPTETTPPKETGGLTFEEVSSLGGDVGNYDFRDGQFFPKTSSPQSDKIGQLKDEVNADYDATTNTLNDMARGVDAATANQIASLTALYNQRRIEMQDANRRSNQSLNTSMIRSGANRYASEVATGILSADEREGIKKIQSLDLELNKAIGEANQAAQDRKWQIMSKSLDIADQKRKDKVAEITKLQEIANKKKEEEDLAKKEFLKDQSEIIKNAGVGGAPRDVLDAIARSKNLSEAMTAAGNYLQGGTGIIGEYNYYKRDAVAHGQVPLTFDEYETRDANRKIVQAKANVGGLPNNIATQVDKLSASFDASPIVKNYNEVQNKKLSVDSILKSGVKGPGDLSVVYEFMKALDPTSVVRESEYASASKSGNLFQGIYARFNGYLKEGGGFLPDNVKKDFQSIINQKFQVATEQYQNLREETGKKIDRKIAGYDDSAGTDYLTDHSAASTASATVDEEEKAKASIIDYGTKNPDKQAYIKSLTTQIQPETGKPLTYSEMLQVLNIPQVKGFWESIVPAKTINYTRDGYSEIGPVEITSADYNKYPPYGQTQKFPSQTDQAPQGTQATSTVASKVAIPKSSRLSHVNNNPGNLMFAGQDGAKNGEKGFAKFSTPEAGYKALVSQVKIDSNRGLTLKQFVTKFAPPTENNTKLYIKQIAAAAGISPNTPISKVNPYTLANHIAQKESGTIIKH